MVGEPDYQIFEGRRWEECLWTHQGYETKRDLAEFGEKVLYTPLTGSQNIRGNMSMRQEFGIVLGLRMRSDEALIGTAKGVIRCKYFRRLDANECWDKKMIESMPGRPSCPVPGRPGDFVPVHISDGPDVPHDLADVDEPLKDYGGQGEIVGNEARADCDMKKMTIRNELLEKYCYNDENEAKCAGYTAVKDGNIWYTHNEECRRILRERIAEDEDGQRRLLR